MSAFRRLRLKSIITYHLQLPSTPRLYNPTITMNPLINSAKPQVHQATRRSSVIAKRAASSMPSSTQAPTSDHVLAEGTCPYADKTHEFRPRQKGDSRSPCPALNALANHGYLPRDGKNIGPLDLVRALRDGYNLSTVLAAILSFGAALMLGQFRSMSLFDLSRHGLIEHNASLVHKDDVDGAEYAPTRVNKKLLDRVCAESGKVIPHRMTLEDAARIRLLRENESGPLDIAHAEVARGEITIAIGVLGGKDAVKNGVDIKVLHDWMQYERLPTDWKPDHTHGLYQSYKMAKYVRQRMREMKAEQPPEETSGL